MAKEKVYAPAELEKGFNSYSIRVSQLGWSVFSPPPRKFIRP
jgi:hypothetical protein